MRSFKSRSLTRTFVLPKQDKRAGAEKIMFLAMDFTEAKGFSDWVRVTQKVLTLRIIVLPAL